MLRFHANLFAAPPAAAPRATMLLRGCTVTPLGDGQSGPPLFTATLPLTFEQCVERLLTIPRMDAEPDGFFVVAGGEATGQRWQIDGHLHEYQGRLHRIELHGTCPSEILDTLLHACGCPEASIVFELVHEGVTLSEADFRRWAVAE